MEIRLVDSKEELAEITRELKDGGGLVDHKVLQKASELNEKGFEGLRKTDNRVIADARLMLYRRVPIWVGFVNGSPVTLHAAHLGKKKDNAWTPYANSYIAFTRMSERRKGHASELFLHVRKIATEHGCVRMKALIGTTLGVRFHQHFRDHIWAVNDRHMLVVDTPLVDSTKFPAEATPMSVRPLTNRTTPMSPEEVQEVLDSYVLGYEE